MRYMAITTDGAIDMGDFRSQQSAENFAVEQYGAPYVSAVIPVPNTMVNVTAPAPISTTTLLLIAAGVYLLMTASAPPRKKARRKKR